MSRPRAPVAPGADRRLSAYRLKGIALAPRVWVGRRRSRDEPEQARTFLELYRHSRAAAEIMAGRAVDPHLLHRADLDEHSVIWDVGAARGNGAADLRQLSGGTVHAFEPHPASFAHLEQRFADDPGVRPWGHGLGRRDATATLELAGPGSSVHGDNRGDFPTAEIAIRDVAGVFAELGDDRVDLIKINIEGGEYDLLERMVEQDLVPRFRYVLVQFHEWHRGAHLRRRAIRRALARTHDEVWCYRWIWELWCDRREPHPVTPPPSPELVAAIAAELRARQAAGGERRP